MKRLLAALLCALCLTAFAQAEIQVTFEDMHYGEEAFQMHIDDVTNLLVFQGEEYLLDDDSFSFHEAMTVHGGKTRAVYEMTLPKGKFSVEPTEEPLRIGTVVIDIPRKATLYVGSGNRRSGEYTLEGPITLTDVYQEEILLPRSESGTPLLIDRVYLYSYTVNGETRRYAATLYIDYENYIATYANAAPVQSDAVVTVPQTDSAVEPAVEAAAEAVSAAPAPAALVLPFLVIILALGVILLRRRKAAEPAKLPSAQEEAPFADQAEELMRQVQAESDLIADEEVCAKADAVMRVCRKIILAAAEQPAKASQCRRFLCYYLPTTLKLLTAYRKISRSGVSGQEVDKVRASTLKGLGMILEACQKLLDTLYKGDVLDSALDVEILEKMLKQDGLIDSELDLSKVIPLESETK